MAQTTALSNRGVIQAAAVVIFGFLTSGVLGFVRTAVLASQFGASDVLDAFYTAQRIPEVIFVLVAGGALGSSFIPVYARFREQDTAQAWRLASAVMTLAAMAAALLGLAVILLADWLVATILLPSSPPAMQALTATMTRMMMITPMIFACSGLIMGILQTHGLFLLPSIAASMNSIGIIFGALVLAPLMATVPYTPLDATLNALTIPAFDSYNALPVDQIGRNSVYGLAFGAILSAILHLAVQIPGLFKIKARLRVLPDIRMDGVWQVLKLMGPRVLGLGVVQVNFIVNIILTDGMVDGSLTALTIAFQLMFTALGVIGQGVSVAVFPTLAALFAAGDYDTYKDRLSGAMRSVLFLAIPATVAFIVLGEPLVSIFESNEWSRVGTQATAWALSFYALGIAGFALLEVLSRAFYALSDTWTPVLVGVGAIVANIVLSLVFIQFIGVPGDLARGPFAGLALANALTTLVEALVLWWLMRRRIGAQGATAGIRDRAIISTAIRTTLAALIMGGAIVALDTVLPLEGFVFFVVGGALGGMTFFIAAIVLGVDEARAVPMMIYRRFRRA